VLVALVLGAGTDEEQQAHALDFFHLTLAVVVILQDQAVQLLGSVVADCIDGKIVIFPPPLEREQNSRKYCYLLDCSVVCFGN